MTTIEFHATVKNGVIEIPTEYLDQINNQVRVILVPESEKSHQSNLIDQLLEKPVRIHDFRPLKRDDLYER
jgi:hypothetical protein